MLPVFWIYQTEISNLLRVNFYENLKQIAILYKFSLTTNERNVLQTVEIRLNCCYCTCDRIHHQRPSLKNRHQVPILFQGSFVRTNRRFSINLHWSAKNLFCRKETLHNVHGSFYRKWNVQIYPLPLYPALRKHATYGATDPWYWIPSVTAKISADILSKLSVARSW